MYEIEKYGGRQIRKDDSCCYLVQFDTLEHMELWMKLMRRYYTQDHLAWSVNREALVVAM